MTVSVQRAQKTSAPGQALTIYYGGRNFLLTARSFVLDRQRTPYWRLAATLLIALKEPFELSVDQGARLTANVALIAPKVLRRQITAINSEISIIDIPIESPEYRRISPLVRGRTLVSLEPSQFAALMPQLRLAAEGRLSRAQFASLNRTAVRCIVGRDAPESNLDPRVIRAMNLIGKLPLDEISLSGLAAELNMSPSRLRHLFCKETGSTVRHYARWVAVWRAVNQWTPEKTYTRIAQDGGFHDLAHLDRAFVEVFGMNPSTIFNSPAVRLVHYPMG